MKTQDIELRIKELEAEQERLRETLKTTCEKTQKENEVVYNEVRAENYTPDWQMSTD